jgi:hypothetical protein
MAKNISKSIRISEEVFDYIDQAPGKGFNEKFENIILSAKIDESDRKKRIAELDEEIQQKRCDLKKLFDQNRYMDEFFRGVLRMQHQLFDLNELLDKSTGTVTENDLKNEKEILKNGQD